MKPGRKSLASLSVVTPMPARLIQPPPDLTPDQAAIWANVVATKPSDWWDAGSIPLLSAYCRAVVESLKVATLVDGMTVDMLLLDDGLERYKELRKIQANLTAEVNTLSRAMRLTQQSRYRADAASVAAEKARGARPWHRVIEHDEPE